MKSRTFYALSFCATFGTVLAFIVAFVQLLHIQKPGKYAKVALKEKQDTAEFSVNEELGKRNSRADSLEIGLTVYKLLESILVLQTVVSGSSETTRSKLYQMPKDG